MSEKKYRTISVPAHMFPLMDEIMKAMPGYTSYASVVVDSIRRRHEAVMTSKPMVEVQGSVPTDMVVSQ
jgi:hypothetical protein